MTPTRTSGQPSWSKSVTTSARASPWTTNPVWSGRTGTNVPSLPHGEALGGIESRRRQHLGKRGVGKGTDGGKPGRRAGNRVRQRWQAAPRDKPVTVEAGLDESGLAGVVEVADADTAASALVLQQFRPAGGRELVDQTHARVLGRQARERGRARRGRVGRRTAGLCPPDGARYAAEVVSRLILHEDEHLLVINKPAGWNTHAPHPFAGEGVYDWLRHREPRWAHLAIIHRLDKATSGVLVFAKTPVANRSLTDQFTRHLVRKRYLLLTATPPPERELLVRSRLVRRGERYASDARAPAGREAITRFVQRGNGPGGATVVEAEPRTGRTHQIRVHAAEQGFPVLGDTLYGGPAADRLYLHAAQLELADPLTGAMRRFAAEPEFAEPARDRLREAMIVPEETDAWRVAHSEAPLPGWYIDRWGDWLLANGPDTAGTSRERQAVQEELERWCRRYGLRGALCRRGRGDPQARARNANPGQWMCGDVAPAAWTVRENGVRFEVRLGGPADVATTATSGRQERAGGPDASPTAPGGSGSVGLFLDQRDNRRRLLVNHVAAGFPAFPNPPVGAAVLNLFAYTCGFSVCAAKAGAQTTSVDLSRRYLEWGQRNFVLNGLDPAQHEFLHGDVFEWLRRLARKARRFAVVLVDPPTFSTSKASGVFRAEADYERLVRAVLPLIGPAGRLFASTNAATLAPERFVAGLHRAVAAGGRRILEEHYAPQPPDFPSSSEAPAYLKTTWLRLD